MKIINLLPQFAQREIKLHILGRQLHTFGIVIVGSLIIVFFLGLASAFWIQKSISSANVEIFTLNNSLTSSDNRILEEEVKSLNQEIKTINNLRNQHYYYSKALLEFANLVPANMQISLLTLDRLSGKVEVFGTAKSRDSVLDFWSNVKKSNFFTNIDFPLANLEQATNSQFSFTFYIKRDQILEK